MVMVLLLFCFSFLSCVCLVNIQYIIGDSFFCCVARVTHICLCIYMLYKYNYLGSSGGVYLVAGSLSFSLSFVFASQFCRRHSFIYPALHSTSHLHFASWVIWHTVTLRLADCFDYICTKSPKFTSTGLLSVASNALKRSTPSWPRIVSNCVRKNYGRVRR